MLDKIVVRGARQHNLKNISVEIPRHKFTVVTGLSGSGKSSLAFDTIYAEGQRRYIESLSAYARQFLERMERPEVDSAEGLSPAISIEQKTTSRSPRSTVGTVTEIYNYMRLLFASIGKPNCHICGKPISNQSLDQIVDLITAYPENTRVIIMAPVVRDRKGEFKKLFETYLKRGYIRARVDGEMREPEEDIPLSKTRNHSVDVVVDRVLIKTGIRRRMELSVKAAIELAEGLVTVSAIGLEERLFSERQACIDCGISIPTLEPRSFSFNSRHGACPDCGGMGTQMTVNPENLVLHYRCIQVYSKSLSKASNSGVSCHRFRQIGRVRMPEAYIRHFYRKFEGRDSRIQGKLGSLSFLSLCRPIPRRAWRWDPLQALPGVRPGGPTQFRP
jgi:excinuclease ABC subunit A